MTSDGSKPGSLRYKDCERIRVTEPVTANDTAPKPEPAKRRRQRPRRRRRHGAGRGAGAGGRGRRADVRRARPIPAFISWRCWRSCRTVGVFSLFALASGIIRFAGKDTGNPMIRAVVDGAFDGIVVTDAGGRVMYANAAYLALVDAVDAKDVRPVERVFIGDPGCVGGGLSSAEGVARRPPSAGRGAGRGLQRQGRALAAHAGAAAGDGKQTAAPRSGALPMSRATARSRKTSSRNCSTRSIISITRRPASSRSMRRRRRLSQCDARGLARSGSRGRSAPAD